jgi:DNA-binding response OmpR family regulator
MSKRRAGNRVVMIDGVQVELSPAEYQVYAVLEKNKGRPVRPTDIELQATGEINPNRPGHYALVNVHRIRNSFQAAGVPRQRIVSSHEDGYTLVSYGPRDGEK